MKRIILSLTVLLFTYAWIYHTASTVEKTKQINPVIGDESFVKKFGFYPDATIDETLRIKTHLEYVETVLRKKNTDNLTPGVRCKRMELLDYLHDYNKAGIFPEIDDRSVQYLPCFIDKDGRICAVGYLIEKSAGRQLAENINRKCRYKNLSAMNTRQVNEWLSATGLTKQECELIQPAFN